MGKYFVAHLSTTKVTITLYTVARSVYLMQARRNRSGRSGHDPTKISGSLLKKTLLPAVCWASFWSDQFSGICSKVDIKAPRMLLRWQWSEAVNAQSLLSTFTVLVLLICTRTGSTHQFCSQRDFAGLSPNLKRKASYSDHSVHQSSSYYRCFWLSIGGCFCRLKVHQRPSQKA